MPKLTPRQKARKKVSTMGVLKYKKEIREALGPTKKKKKKKRTMTAKR
jgi:hypothetical protein